MFKCPSCRASTVAYNHGEYVPTYQLEVLPVYDVIDSGYIKIIICKECNWAEEVDFRTGKW